MPGPRDQLLPLLQLLYAAPGNGKVWEVFLEALTTAVGGNATGFVVYDPAAHTGNIALGIRMDPRDVREYDTHWVREDPWGTSPKWLELGSGRVVVGEELISTSDVRKTAYYNDFGRRVGLTQCLAGLIDKRGGRFGFLAIDRPDNAPAFGSEEADLLSALMPHLQRALQVHRRIVTAESLLTDAIDAVGEALFVIAGTGRVVRMNRAAEVLVRQRNGLTLRGGELNFSTDTATTQLRRAIGQAIATSAGEGMTSGGRFLVERASGGVLRVVVAPTRAANEFMGPEAHALVLISTRHTQAPPSDLLRRLFDLTEAESRLARALANGQTLRQAAQDLGLRDSTVRTYLKVIFQKTNTHRQIELITLLSNLGDRQ